MAKRHVSALYIQHPGASNPSGVLQEMARAVDEIRKEENFKGTSSLCTDAALRLMCHQLGFLLGGGDFYHLEGEAYNKDTATCFALAGDDLDEYAREYWAPVRKETTNG